MHKPALRVDDVLEQAREVLGTKDGDRDNPHGPRRGRERLFECLRTHNGIDPADETTMAKAWR